MEFGQTDDSWGLPATKMSKGPLILWLVIELQRLYLSKCSQTFHLGVPGGLAPPGFPWLIYKGEVHFIPASTHLLLFGRSLPFFVTQGLS